MSNDSKSSSLPPSVGEFAIEDRQRLLGRIAELEEALELADRGVANCELFRQRLAKYEDAEGRPVQPSMPDALAKIGAFLLGEGEIDGHSFGDARPDMDGMFWWRKELRTAIESQAREIERLNIERDQCYAVATSRGLEIAALKAQPTDYEAAMAQQRSRINASMANTLKSQPTGVVLPEPLKAAIIRADDVLHALAGWESSSLKLEQRHGADWLKEVDAIRRELHTQLARLNSSPVSAGEPAKCSYRDDPRSPAELSLAGCRCVRFGEGNPHWPCKLHTAVSAGGLDELAAFNAYLNEVVETKQYGTLTIKLQRHDEYTARDEQIAMEAWQARSALTAPAPSHSEQVREGWKAGFKLHEVHKALDCGLPHPSYWAETCDGEPHVHTKLWRGLPGCGSFHSSRFWPLYGVSMLAAAPSAGNQQGGGTL